MKQINKSPDVSVLLREAFNDEASVRLNGGICTNVEFVNGSGFFQNNGYITYSNPVYSIGAFAIRACVKLTITNLYNVIASFDNIDTLELRTELNGELILYIGSSKKSSGKILAVNTWYDIVVTRDDSGVVTFYVDGVAYAGGTQTGTFYGKNLTIGKRGASSTIFFNGYISLFEYYDRNLTTGEVTYLINNRIFRPTDEAKRNRVGINGGTQGDMMDYKSLITFYRKRGMWDKTKLLVAPFLGVKAASGLIEAVYDVKGSILSNNDLVQSSGSSKPYLRGNIAPNEVLSMSNPNGDARYLTHPAISFAANQAWSVSVVFNVNISSSSAGPGSGILGNSSHQTTVSVTQTPNLRLRNESGTDVYLVNVQRLIGKNRVLTLVANGDGIINVYIDGVFLSSPSIISNFSFDRIMVGRGGNFNGAAHFYRIQSGAMTATQVLAEYNKLRTYIPEIETVQIGSKYITSSNFQAVATPAGNVIQEMQTASAVEKITNAADREFSSDTGFWVKKGDTVINGGVCTYSGLGILSYSSANWCLRKDNVLNTNKWYKILVDAKLISGTGSLYIGFGYLFFIINITSTTQTYTIIAKNSGNENVISVGGDSGSVFEIDNISYQELNWSNATEIYDAVYAATSGTAAQKEYAALKEAAMWCSHSNSTSYQSIFGKIFNAYSRDLLKADLLSQSFGYHIATKAELQALGSSANALKVSGTDYWTTSNGDNLTGLTLLGGAYRSGSDGSFGTIKETVEIWCGDTDEVMQISDSSDTVNFISASKGRGAYIRLIKN